MSVLKVVDGKVVDTSTSTKAASSTTGTSALDKNAFLQLLVTQMKYQDPLNPSTDTQFVQQLATFTQLEQMSNLNQTTSNNQAFGLVGMEVEVTTKDAAGKETTKAGSVDFIVMNKGVAKLSVNGSLYTLDQVTAVIDSTYTFQKGLPYVAKAVDATFDKEKPEDVTFNVNLGSGKTVATDVAVIINNTVVDSKYVKLEGTKVTISKEALAKLDDGIFKPTVMFNDANYTVISNQISITVKGTVKKDPDKTEEDSDKSGTGTDKTGEVGTKK